MKESDVLLCVKEGHYLILGERYTYQWGKIASAIYGKNNRSNCDVFLLNSLHVERILLDHCVVDTGYTDEDIFHLKISGELPNE